ncbi:hypothetical protein Droror1_Dr00023475 [Drosera rotundifolia]
MGCVGVNDKSVMAEMVKAVCKRKSDFQRVVTEGLVVVGFDASICSLILMLLCESTQFLPQTFPISSNLHLFGVMSTQGGQSALSAY